MNYLKFQGLGNLPSQPEVNLKNVSVMTLKSENEIEGPKPIFPKDKSEDRIEKETEEEGLIKTTPEITSNLIIQIKSNLTPFPNRLEKFKKQDEEREISKVF